KMVKRLGGRRWNRLHKLAYVAAISGVVHYYLLVKADTRIPLAFGFVLAVLFGYRMLNKFLPSLTERRFARPPAAKPAPAIVDCIHQVFELRIVTRNQY